MQIFKSNATEGFSFWKIYRRKIISRSGQQAGRLIGIFFNGGVVTAIHVRYRFRKIVIGSEYIQNLESVDQKARLVLNIDPVYLLPGRRVYDSEGRNLGHVYRIEQDGDRNNYSSLLVKKNTFSRPLTVSPEVVQVVKKNIILSVPFSELNSTGEKRLSN